MGFFSKKRIYLDYASSTPVSEEAVRAMRKVEKLIGNPGSIHENGVAAKKALEEARTKIAAELGCKAREIIFTSGITESNNLAILGSFKKKVLGGETAKWGHWVTSSMEHSSVLACFQHIKEMGGMVSFVNPDARGIISAEAVQKELRKETVFVSIGWANNETGTIQPLSEISQVLRRHEELNKTKILFHSDAGQAPLYLSAQINSLRVDLFSLGAAKLYGPHGIGALFVSNRAELAPIILGGGQERGLRSGTENAALAAGFAEALLCAAKERGSEARRLAKLRDELARELVAGILGVKINGDLKHSLPHMLNISIPNANTEYLVLALDRAGVAVSTKSACNEGERMSYVVACLAEAASKAEAGGASEKWRAENTLRISLGRPTSPADIREATRNILAAVKSTNINC